MKLDNTVGKPLDMDGMCETMEDAMLLGRTMEVMGFAEWNNGRWCTLLSGCYSI